MRDMYRIKIYNCDIKEFDTGIGDFNATMERTAAYLEKMQPNFEVLTNTNPKKKRGRKR